MTTLNQIAAGAGADTRVNENFRAAAPAALYGIKAIAGLVLTLYGGQFNGVTVADLNVTLTASNTNYVVAHRTTGAVTAATNTTNWNNQATYLRLYQIVAGTSTMTIAADSDKRQAFGDFSGGPDTASLSTGLSTANSNIASLSSSLSTTASGLSSLSTSTSTGLSTATSSIGSLSTSTSTGLSTATSGISSLSSSVSTTNSSLASLSTSTSTGLSTATSSIGSLSTSTSTGLSTAASGITSLSTGLSTVTSSVASLSTSVYVPRVQSVTSAATVTPTFSNDIVKVTAQAVALTLANPTGTAVDSAGLVIRIKDNGTPRAITYGTQYRPIGLLLPTSTTLNKTLYLAMVYNAEDTRWDVLAVGQEA